ncbi:magnesium transporter [Aerococcaceae bacterium zg-ZJ1578]|uniref:magnesium transporter n=1 Tax=Aerococcaceae TaxID=186827 RepID=UPI0013B99D43|nr:MULTISPECIES: magnesium transporter [unclassified Facklamia]MBK0348697.1 magnesium transporter [Aerococcaceae bacterium zg-1578]MBR7927216.1 magnesium transporter [Aerococcaceae bacterium zg-ZUI334]MBS4462605.1 magnesium transporter [Aerococcaceae bacterium zg-B36]QQD66268.1 magnesium transporter [Aerococcaceae bacterium zg-252]NEW63721.1 magnesium transporter [Facklamia sp. 252]
METINQLNEIRDQFTELINQKRTKAAYELIKNLNEVDIAHLIDELDPTIGVILYRLLPKAIATLVFANFDTEQQTAIINASTDQEIEHILNELYFDDMVDLIEEMPSNVVNDILKHTSAAERQLINQFLMYPDSSAGSMMTIEYVSLKKEFTVREALDKIKREGIDKETIYTLYVTDEKRVLEGILSLRELIVADLDTKIKSLMSEDVIYAHTLDDREDVAKQFSKYDLTALPIVDNEKRIVGIITVDDVLDVLEEETTEDFQIMAATTPNEKPYMSTSVLELAKDRIFWLLILMISATVTQKIINNYESILSSTAFLSGFIPMLMDTGGNSGSQSSTLIIRSLAINDVTTGDWLSVLWKEFRVALLCGVVLAFVNYFKIIYIDRIPANIALTVSITLIFSVMSAKIAGGALPLLAHKLKLDPAIMASPLITTIADAISLVVYFMLARTIIGF